MYRFVAGLVSSQKLTHLNESTTYHSQTGSHSRGGQGGSCWSSIPICTSYIFSKLSHPYHVQLLGKQCLVSCLSRSETDIHKTGDKQIILWWYYSGWMAEHHFGSSRIELVLKSDKTTPAHFDLDREGRGLQPARSSSAFKDLNLIKQYKSGSLQSVYGTCSEGVPSPGIVLIKSTPPRPAQVISRPKLPAVHSTGRRACN